MSSIRNSRTRLLTAAAAVALAALSLTACDDGTGTRDEGASPEASASASRTAADASATASRTSGGRASSQDARTDGGGSRPAALRSPSKRTASSARTVTCEGSGTGMVAAPLNRPVNHMLLTVTNTGRNTCYLYGYPAVRFGEAQSVPPAVEESRPQAVVTLKPGESGYASVSLSATDGSGAHGRTEKSLTVWFQGRSGSESVGAGAHPELPAKGVYIDDSLRVTYWQQSMDDAVSW